MIILDTNVISEPLRPAPDPVVLEWLDEQHIETVYLTSITVAELRFGIAALPRGKRRDRLEEDFERRILSLFADRILPFDAAATHAYAQIRAAAKTAGRPIGVADSLIAAIAAHHGCAIATRDVAPFELAGLDVVNPWQR